ncbi:MAG: hypothetical protein ILP22_05045, partial [Oscillospiraceae bacterium]|nr:hypothetical protein [Oscillospiraceae bacterium]
MKRNAVKKAVLLSLSLCIAGMLAGCGKTASDSSSAGKKADRPSESKTSEAEKEVEHSADAQEFDENIIGTADGYG